MPSKTLPCLLALPFAVLFAGCGGPGGSETTGGTGGAASGGTGGTAATTGGTTASGTGGMSAGASGGAPNGSGGSSMGGKASGGTTTSTGGVANAGASTGGSAAASTGGTAGTPASTGGSAGASSAGAGGAGATGGTGGTSNGGWRAAIASGLTEQKLTDEYNAWKAANAQSCTNGSWVVKKDAGSVVSEGIGYGMLLSANRGDRVLFDGLWKYYTDHLDPKGLMNWATGLCDAPGNNNANAATDGDLDVAMALIQAHARWPDGGYLTLAGALSDKIVQHETEDCSGRAILRPGDMFGGCSDTGGNAKINPSYFAPGYYRVFAHYFPAQAARWNALVDGSYELHALYQARMSGLVPDWSKFDGSDWYGSMYSYDACRTPWRVMVDYAWTGDARALTFMKNVNTWVDAHGLVGSQPNNSAFVGALALASAYDKTRFDAAVTTWLGSKGDDMPYYQGTLRVLYLLAAAGQFPSTL